MIRLISNDGKPVEFPRTLVREIPYARDAVTNIETFEETLDLPTPFASEAQLLLLKRVLIPKATLGVSFIPSFGDITIGGAILSRPPFSSLAWVSSLDTVFHGLVESQIVDLLCIAQAMCMWQLRDGVLFLMLHRLLKGQNAFEQFFEENPYGLTNILVETYKMGVNQRRSQ
jgi:hypothetical protein